MSYVIEKYVPPYHICTYVCHNLNLVSRARPFFPIFICGGGKKSLVKWVWCLARQDFLGVRTTLIIIFFDLLRLVALQSFVICHVLAVELDE